VQSVGLIPNNLQFSSPNSVIQYFRHALALDEHCVKFIPSFYAGGKPKLEGTDSRVPGSSSDAGGTGVDGTTGQNTDVKEVFFAGAHCGVA
jgi:hypothetical protein